MGVYIPNLDEKKFYEICKEHNLDFIATPAADVRSVVRGKWKQDELSKRLDLYVCSECGQPLQIVNADGGKTATAYCPNCGADMREES